MKKFISILLLFSALVLTGELIHSPLMHNHKDFIERNNCPAYLITSNQLSNTGLIFVEIFLRSFNNGETFFPQTFPSIKFTHAETFSNKSPPFILPA